MALAEVLYSEIYEKLSEYAGRLRQNRFKMEAAFSAYEAKCAAKDRQLKEALLENAHKQSRLEAELAPLDVNLNEKDKIARAEEATGMLSALKKEAKKLKKSHEAEKQELDREFKTTENRFMNEAGKLKAEVREYLDSLELKRFAFIINSDRALYDNAAVHGSDSLSGSDYISIGTLRAPIPVHEEFLLKFTMLFNYNFDAATRTIALPACIDMKKGQSIVVEYLGTTQQEMLSGIRNFVLNTSRYLGGGLDDKRELLLFQNFPEDYDAKQINDIRRMCVEAADSGNIIILTHNSAFKNVEAVDTFTFIKSISMNIESKMGGFFMEVNKKKEIAAFKWYSSLESVADESPEEITDAITDEKFAVYIDGSRRSLLHNIITSIIKNAHPDDVELWLIDFGKYEFERYINCLPPHVRYLISEESTELVYDIIDRLADVLLKRQNIFKDNGWKDYSEVPSEKYMPLIVVMINELAFVSQAVQSSMEGHKTKLQLLFEEGEAAGFRFILSGNEKLEEYKGFTESTMNQIWQYNIGKLSIKGIKLSPLCIMDQEEQAELIGSVCKSLRPVLVYRTDDLSAYIDKKPVVIDGNKYTVFDNAKVFMNECIANRDNGTILLFLGEARRMSATCPIAIERESFENIVIIAPDTERESVASLIKSSFESLKLQNISFEIWGSVRSNIFRQLQNCMNEEVFMAKNIEDIRVQIGTVKQDIIARKKTNRFIVLIGFEALLNTTGNLYPSIYDSSADIRFILTYGPHLGYHFILVFGTKAEFERSKMPESIFRHKLVSQLKCNSFRYSNGNDEVTFKPYLHEGLAWGGWKVIDNVVSREVAEEEYLL